MLRPSEAAKKNYFEQYLAVAEPIFAPFFNKLESLSDEQLATVTEAVFILSGKSQDYNESGGDILERI